MEPDLQHSIPDVQPDAPEASPHVQFWHYRTLASHQGQEAPDGQDGQPATAAEVSAYTRQMAQATRQAAIDMAERTMAGYKADGQQAAPGSPQPPARFASAPAATTAPAPSVPAATAAPAPSHPGPTPDPDASSAPAPLPNPALQYASPAPAAASPASAPAAVGSLRSQQQESMRGQHAAVEVAPERPSALRSFLSFVVMLAVVVGAAWLLRTFVIAPYEIPSGSMESTIMVSDKVFSEKVSYYLHGVNPGDIVTFDDPEVAGRTLIKRCIAVGGQTVDLQDGTVVVDGQPLDEPYTRGLPSEPLMPADGVTISYPYTVPEGYIWVMGDNRTNSADSRYFGAVAEDSVTGHACLTYWPIERIGVLE